MMYSVNITEVSIPFKRERTLQDTQKKRTASRVPLLFRFPSNGKGHCKWVGSAGPSGSVLFLFPSNGKGHCKIRDQQGLNASKFYLFQFPSNGKGHCKFDRGVVFILCHPGFLFPSNGKGHCKLIAGVVVIVGTGFYSLQTGKDIARADGKVKRAV